MDVNIQRKIDQVAGTLICGLLSLLPAKKTEGRRRPRKICVILLSEMGSLVLAHPMFENIRKKYPEAECYALVFEQNREILDLMNVIPPEKVITISNRSLVSLLFGSIQAVRRLRAAAIDTVIDCELFSRISSIFSFLCGAGVRVGFHRHKQEGLYRGGFINRPVLYNPYHHISRQFVTLSEAIDGERFPLVKQRPAKAPHRLPAYFFSKTDIDHAKDRLNADFPSITGKKLVLLYPGGGLLPIRAWPIDCYSALVEELTGKGYAVAVIGLETDRPLAEKIQAGCGGNHCVDLTGYTKTIRDLIAIFHVASLLITNDGGPGHFAALTPIPTIIFYGPETPVLYGPLSENSHVFFEGFTCSPCLSAYNHRNSPCDGDNLCLQSISVDRVLSKAEEFLQLERPEKA